MGGLALPALDARGGGAVVFLVLGYLGDSFILGDFQGLGDRPEKKSPFPYGGGKGGYIFGKVLISKLVDHGICFNFVELGKKMDVSTE